MVALIRAERLKMRHSFGGFLPVSVAGLQVVISLFLSRGTDYYSVNAWNWWYVMILPGMLAILCYLGIKKEKRQNYANLLATHVPPERCLVAKILYYASKLLCANLLLFLGTFAGGILIGSPIPMVNGLAAALLLSICYLWEIQLYMMQAVVDLSGIGSLPADVSCAADHAQRTACRAGQSLSKGYRSVWELPRACCLQFS